MRRGSAGTRCSLALAALFCASAASGREALDPAASIAHPRLESTLHQPLPEQYIWTRGDAAALTRITYNWRKQTFKTEPHYFRRAFELASVPPRATLYVAGPRSARAFLNGRLVDDVKSDPDSPLGQHVFAADVTRSLRAGPNTLALEVVRGRGIVSASNSARTSQLAFGEVLAVKIVPAPRGVDEPALLISDASWRSTLHAAPGWEQPGFDDRAWPLVDSLGPIEGNIDFFQWNADAGLYDWPGYDGISSFLARYSLPPVSVTHIFEGRGHIADADALTRQDPQASETGEFAVWLPAPFVEDEQAPSILLDFGREVAGRVEFVSDSDAPAEVTIQYGESEWEAQSNGQYLGVNPLTIPAQGTAYGPKSAFRYAKIRFIAAAAPLRFLAIRLDGIFYPVRYQGSFESSDSLVNRIWETAVYTAHLSMQDGIWDAPKRDRGRWMGDLDVSGHVIDKVFADRFLMEDTLNRLIGKEPVEQHVNGIAGYSAFWITGEADFYRHQGDRAHLESIHRRLVELQRFMDTELNARQLYANRTRSWPFVDWSPDLYGDTAEARRATEFEFYKAYREGAWLLHELGDSANAEHFEHRAAALRDASARYLFDSGSGSYGPRWQTNAMAVLSGIAGPSRYASIWDGVLSAVGHEKFSAFPISPYYNYYVVSAMAKMGHRRQALEWIRKYWGGMLDEGATSFWEAYDPSWPKDKFHLSLQADGTSGFFVSLAHGWSSGPAAWLMEEVLGIEPTSPGFEAVTIRPDLVNLEWARGAEPTPHGAIRIDLRRDAGAGLETDLDLPAGVAAEVLVPVPGAAARVLVNGRPVPFTAAESGSRARIALHSAGHFEIRTGS